MIKNKVDAILNVVNNVDYERGMRYFKPYINYIESENLGEMVVHYFSVESETSYNEYDVSIFIDSKTGNIEDKYCSCPRFDQIHSCKHVAACLIEYYDEIVPKIITEDDKRKLANMLFNAFEITDKNKSNDRKIKEELKIDIYVTGKNYNANNINTLNLELKIGTNKLYSCKDRKLSQFLDAYQSKNDFYFGKSFTYSPRTCFLSEENNKIINYLLFLNEHKDAYYDTYTFLKGKQTIIDFFDLVSNRKIYLNGKGIIGYKREFPFESKLFENEKDYHLKFSLESDFTVITNDLEYIQIGNSLYRLNEKEQMIVYALLINKMDEMIIEKSEKNRLSNNILTTVHNKLEIDDNIKDITISKNVSTKLYFDLYRDKIICNLKFIYDNIEIDYFDNNCDVLRNIDYENEVLNDLLSYKFEVNDNKILLNDFDEVGNFLENSLIKLTEKYDTYTSEKIKNITLVKKASIKSMFSIGKDNIMSYSFSMDNINSDEVVNILNAYKNKKKYYKLKSGDILNIENSTDLEELDNLIDDININTIDIEKGNIELPKYRAIYLDSLKNNKYHIIDTNNMFDELINKFYKYKDCPINLSNSDKKILRDYQKDGVKWLCNIDRTGFGGILADEMGLGKSIQTIYYIKELLKDNKDYKFLIVSPTSLAYNWEREFGKFEPSLKKCVIVGDRKTRRNLFNNFDNYNIFITTYGLLREDKEFYDDIVFKTIVIDEAQNIKNTQAELTKTVKTINSETKLALTGTPIENSIDELWSIFDFIMPGFLPDLTTFDRKYKIRDFDDESNKKISELNGIISPFILRRRKKDVIKDLPPKIENNIFVDLDDEQKKLYLAELERVHKETEEILSSGGVSKLRFMILQLLTKLRQLCIDPRLIYSDYNGGSGKISEFVNVVNNMVLTGHKMLVFTSFRGALDLAKKELDKNNISSYVIDGSVSSKKRFELVEKFNNDDTNVFFIMLKAGGTGLNLTSADIVIHLDLWWNPQAENQATDRTHRIGQKNTVEVIKLISKGTIEEKILELQEKKKILSEKLIDEKTNDITFDKLTDEDIKNLLSYDE